MSGTSVFRLKNTELKEPSRRNILLTITGVRDCENAELEMFDWKKADFEEIYLNLAPSTVFKAFNDPQGSFCHMTDSEGLIQ